MNESTEEVALARQSNEIIEAAIKHNQGGIFEYKVVPVGDMLSGEANADKIEELLNLYGEMGWMFKEAIVNEIGHVLSTAHDAPSLTNVQEQTLLVFERWRRL